MISYKPLWHTLLERDMKKLDLVEKFGISRGTLAKLSKNESVSVSIIDRICGNLDCSITDVLEIISEREI